MTTFGNQGNRWLARLDSGPARRYLGSAIVRETLDVVRTGRPAEPMDGEVQPNRDLFPRDELRTPIHR